jgi:hypothetical protein
MNGDELLGTVTPDGFLVVAAVHRAATGMFVLRLSADTLTTEYALSSQDDMLLPNPGATWKRRLVEDRK